MKKFLLCLTLVAMATACSREPEPVAVEEVADVAAGKALVEANCTSCHGHDGGGTAAGIPDLAAQPEAYLRAALTAYRDGTRTHAALHDLTAELTDPNIRNIAAYYASLPSLGTATAAQLPDERFIYEQGEIAAAECETCHGSNGNSTTSGIPSLAGQQPLYFIAATQAYINGSREHPTAKTMMSGMERVDLEKLALYFASQVPPSREAPEVGDPVAGEPLSAVCGGCHGMDGVSHDATTPNLAGQDPVYLAAAIRAYRDFNRHDEFMLAEAGDEQIADIAAFYAVQTPQAAKREPVSARLLAETCDRCHGPGVENTAIAVPNINGQDRDYLMMVMRAYRDNKRPNSMMHSMSSPYSDTMIEAIATLYANRPAE
jgi:cytochrome c553